MKTSDFFFELPGSLIAQYPPPQRGQSRLMTLDRISGKRGHRMVNDLPEILRPGDMLVFNNSKVRRARLAGRSLETGAAVEFLLVQQNGGQWKCLVQRAKRRRPGSRYVFYGADGAEAARAEITAASGEFRFLSFDRPVDDEWLDQHGHIPLPPYIRREDTQADAGRYQTVYAADSGSSAAPTAGLHFTLELLDRLNSAGIESAFITLHVGLGTFLPVRSEYITGHVMHEEVFNIDGEAADKIERAKAEGRRVVAVGTTSVRTLESAWMESAAGRLRRGEGSTSIFIYPGYCFKVVDALFTNFHTPEST
ncbi:MAG: tRNA preQ1(34) S-adenosylmethionine ribosyltransferase-isomerase QueA, partial [Treponema sp.]|nr:tRNA preQ1(34) S-adenosylmethionine ribosyltransferase-isomerase QueA [Treponema sp.]